MHIFFGSIQADSAILIEPELRHCIKVLRHQVGDYIALIDGEGNYVEGKLAEIGKKEARIAITRKVPDWGEHEGHITLALSPLRLKDRFEWAIEKAVELGANEIVPLLCDHTESQKARFKPERLQTLMRTALKQCGRSRLPDLKPVTPFKKWLESTHGPDLYMAAMPAETPFSPPSMNDTISQITLMIGPEGGFSPEEITLTQSKGATLMSLGSNRLRAETAAVYGLSLIKQRWGF